MKLSTWQNAARAESNAPRLTDLLKAAVTIEVDDLALIAADVIRVL
jgi:hypothetical protein